MASPHFHGVGIPLADPANLAVQHKSGPESTECKTGRLYALVIIGSLFIAGSVVMATLVGLDIVPIFVGYLCVPYFIPIPFALGIIMLGVGAYKLRNPPPQPIIPAEPSLAAPQPASAPADQLSIVDAFIADPSSRECICITPLVSDSLLNLKNQPRPIDEEGPTATGRLRNHLGISYRRLLEILTTSMKELNILGLDNLPIMEEIRQMGDKMGSVLEHLERIAANSELDPSKKIGILKAAIPVFYTHVDTALALDVKRHQAMIAAFKSQPNAQACIEQFQAICRETLRSDSYVPSGNIPLSLVMVMNPELGLDKRNPADFYKMSTWAGIAPI